MHFVLLIIIKKLTVDYLKNSNISKIRIKKKFIFFETIIQRVKNNLENYFDFTLFAGLR